MPYHYHARVQAGKANEAARGDKAAIGTEGSYAEFPAFPMGPDQCWKADVSKQYASMWGSTEGGVDTAPCCGSTQYYARPGVAINGAGSLDTESYCALPGDLGVGVTGRTSISLVGIPGGDALSNACVIHGSLKDGATCDVACATGYAETSAVKDEALRGVGTFSCTKGRLTVPTLKCAAKAGHVFAVTPREVCADCVETTACVAVIEAWMWAAIVGGALVVVGVGAGVAWKVSRGRKKTAGGAGSSKLADVEMVGEV